MEMNRIGAVTAPGKVEFWQREIAPLQPGEALVRVKSSAICGSDLHIFKGLHPSVKLPVTIGHEFSGVVEALGEDCGTLRPGDRVVLEPAIPCGKCDACLHGAYNFCEKISFSYRNGDGAMATFVRCKASRLFLLPEEIGFDEGALIEPLAVAMHAVRKADVKIGDSVAILGAGAIGVFVAAICAAAGAKTVIVTDLSDARLDKARRFGATHTLNSARCDVVEEIVALTGGVDKAFECVGIEVTFNQGLRALKKNGLMTAIGIFEHPKITIDASLFVSREIRLQGAQGYCWDFLLAIDIARKLPLDEMITHRFPLEQLQQAVETAMDPAAGALKVIVHPNE
ncbi:MAG: alcohol dehydrogenase catalytic domain-containing protein [Clostridia bacterium]|nr:alcohol dehydrogenase catalytic domain-containing protein [Clostridia bacterium]